MRGLSWYLQTLALYSPTSSESTKLFFIYSWTTCSFYFFIHVRKSQLLISPLYFPLSLLFFTEHMDSFSFSSHQLSGIFRDWKFLEQKISCAKMGAVPANQASILLSVYVNGIAWYTDFLLLLLFFFYKTGSKGWLKQSCCLSRYTSTI